MSSDDDQDNLAEIDPPDFITAQYEKIQRTKQKFLCLFLVVFFFLCGKDFELAKVTADIEY